jgi:hypothetical protein
VTVPLKVAFAWPNAGSENMQQMMNSLAARKVRDENLDVALNMSYLFQQFDWLNGYRKCEPRHVNA